MFARAPPRPRPRRGAARRARRDAAAFLRLLQHDAADAALPDSAFRRKHGYGDDACLVVADGPGVAVSDPPGPKVQAILQALRRGGVQAAWSRAYPGGDVFILLRCPVARLAAMADDQNMPLPLDPFECELRALKGTDKIAPLNILHDATATRGATPWEKLHGVYDTHQDLQALYAGFPHAFSCPALRLKCLLAVLEAKPRQGGGGCGLRMQNQLRCGDFKALFPLHDAAMARRLLADWNMIDPPLGAVKDYFGERVGMYFAFLCHFAKWCSLSALVGVACTILGFFEKALLHRPRRKSRSLPLFSIFQCLWAIVMLETWKRQEARLCLDWGMHGAGAAWSARPEFVGERRSSLVHGRSELFFSQSARRGRLRLSSCAILVLVFVLGAGALGAILARVYFERWLPKTVFIFGFSAEAKTVASVAGSVFTTLQIEIANYLYSIIAWHLNEYENHRTSQDYMNAMIFKVVPFYLLNYNCPLFYDAFLRRSFEGCTGGAVGGSATRGAGTCYSQLELSLGIIFLTKMVANAVADRLKPWYGTVMRRRAWLRRKADAARRGVKRAAWMKRAVSKRSVGGPAKSDDDDCPAKADYGDFESQKTAPARGTREAKLPDCAEDDFLLEEADDVADTLEDYTTLAIRFSFVTLFVTALPVLPVLAWFANHTEGYLDLTKLLTLKRRLWPRDAGGIGSWLRVFQMITILSVTSNAACIFYVFNWTPLQDDRPLGPAEKAWGFFAFQYAVLFIMFLAELATPDVPDDVAIQLERQKFISSKLIENVPDESTDPDLSDFDDGPSPRSADPPRAEAAFFGAAGVAELAVRSRKKAAPRRSDKAPSYTNARDRGKLKRAFKKVEKGGYASGADLQEVLRKHTSRPASDVAATLPSFGFGDKDRLDLRELEDVHAALQGAAALEESAVAARDIDFEFDGLATALLDC